MRVIHTAWVLIALSSVLLTSAAIPPACFRGCRRLTSCKRWMASASQALLRTGNSGQLARLADTLVFTADGNLDRHVTLRFIDRSTATPDTTIHAIEPLAYEIDGDHLTIHVRSCPANANCIGPSDGHIDARRIDLVDTGWNGATLRFTVR